MGSYVLDPVEGILVYQERELELDHVPSPPTGFRNLYEEIIDLIIGYGK